MVSTELTWKDMERKTNCKVIEKEDNQVWVWSLAEGGKGTNGVKSSGAWARCTYIKKAEYLRQKKMPKTPEDDKNRWDAALSNRPFLGSVNWLHFSAFLMEPDTSCSLGSYLTVTVFSPTWNVLFLSLYCCWFMPMTYFSAKNHLVTLKTFWCPHNMPVRRGGGFLGTPPGHGGKAHVVALMGSEGDIRFILQKTHSA